jgi:hypothetical protein
MAAIAACPMLPDGVVIVPRKGYAKPRPKRGLSKNSQMQF